MDIVKGNHHILSPVDNLDLIKSNKHNKLYDEEYLTKSDIVPYYYPPFNDALMLAAIMRDPLNDLFLKPI